MGMEAPRMTPVDLLLMQLGRTKNPADRIAILAKRLGDVALAKSLDAELQGGSADDQKAILSAAMEKASRPESRDQEKGEKAA